MSGSVPVARRGTGHSERIPVVSFRGVSCLRWLDSTYEKRLQSRLRVMQFGHQQRMIVEDSIPDGTSRRITDYRV